MGVSAAFLLAIALSHTVGPVTIDWTRGVAVVATAAGATLRAPNPQVARLSAERLARRRATERLRKALAGLPVAGGATVGERLGGDADAWGWLDKAVAQAGAEAARYASDGGVELRLRLPLRDVARALGGEAGEASGGAARGRIAIVTAACEPALVPGADLRFYGSVADARRDARLGANPTTVRVTKLSDELRGGPVAVVIER
jgi:hypothetical protein